MNKKELYDNLSVSCSKSTTTMYSTSFSLGILLFTKELRKHIYSIYGFVRLADEIVDTFEGYDQKYLLRDFWFQTYEAIEKGISLNPILNAFQQTVNEYQIPADLIDAFMRSMEMDLHKSNYTEDEVNEYIYGSAEVVGLMCLKVFTRGNEELYNELNPYAKSLGAAFQKVNFLRDLKDDYNQLGRSYFDGLDIENFSEATRDVVEESIQKDFTHALEGIRKLPSGSKFGVYIAYVYYYSLFRKIKRLHFDVIRSRRVRISNPVKYMLLFKCWFQYKLNLV